MARLSVGDRALDELRRRIDGPLVQVDSPLEPCRRADSSPACRAALDDLHNPFFIEDHPGAFQTTGWLGAFTSAPSRYAVAATGPGDIAAAVTFAVEQGMPLVVKGTGHDYLGRSCDPDALTIWTHGLRDVTVHDSFSVAGASRATTGVPAITVGAGTRWLEAYQAVIPRGRYVQGGGCTSVGAAGGFTLGGGFGSFSKRFGTAAGNVVEMEVVTASGEVLVVNELQHSDLFWALRGGGGGTFGIVSKVTFLTHDLPATLCGVIGTVAAGNASDYRQLVRELVAFYPDLDDAHWGELIRLAEDNTLTVSMLAVDLTEEDARAVWRPFTDWLARHTEAFRADVHFADGPFDRLWDVGWWDTNLPSMITRDRRPGAPPEQFWWAINQNEVSQYWHAYQSRWLPAPLFERSKSSALTDALFEASRHWHVTLHANKGLSGAAPEAVRRDRQTSINPAVFDAAALVISASGQQYVFPGVPGHEPDGETAAACSRKVNRAMDAVRKVTPAAGTYPNECDYFEPQWQASLWGDNYQRLLEIKRKYDPDNIFRVHHGVGSELARRRSRRVDGTPPSGNRKDRGL